MTPTPTISISQQALGLVREAMAAFDAQALSATIRRGLRIAMLRGDWRSVWWLDMECVDLNKTDSLARTTEMEAHFPTDQREAVHAAIADAYVNERRVLQVDEKTGKTTEMTSSYSVEQIEAMVADFKIQREQSKPPPGMHTLDLYYAEQRHDLRRLQLSHAIRENENVLSRVRRRVWDFLVRTEAELAFGETSAEVFEQYRTYVDGRLAAVTPSALEQLRAAYRRAAEGGAEERSQAVLSCRRVLKSLADTLYPAVDEPITDGAGATHELTDEKWVNRLWQFVQEQHGRSRSRQLLQATIDEVGHRLDALNDLTSKGLHEAAGPYEVQQAVIQTYVTVGDLLRLHDEASRTSE